MITIYTQPGCPHCVHAMSYLTELEIPYTEIDIRQDADALDFMKEEGHRAVPQLYVGRNLLVEGGNDGLRDLGKGEIEERIAQLS